MPPPVVAAGIAAGGALAGGILQSRSQGRAVDAQERANREALQYQRELEQRRRQEYDQQQAARRAQWEAREARLAPFRAAAASVLRGWGYDAPSFAPTQMPEGWTPGAASASSGPPISLSTLAGMPGGGVSTGARIAPVEAPMAIPQAPQVTTLDSLFGPQIGRPRGGQMGA